MTIVFSIAYIVKKSEARSQKPEYNSIAYIVIARSKVSLSPPIFMRAGSAKAGEAIS
jgi:hypothetical protein